MDLSLRGPGIDTAPVNYGVEEPPSAPELSPADARKTPTITWPAPELLTHGQKLTFAQLNATASVDGTLVYTPGPGYVLPAGMHTLWVTFTPADSGTYAPLQAATSIVVAKATPAIKWRTPAGIIYGSALDEAQLNASAPVPGKFNYSPAAGEVLPPGTHKLSVTFTPADSANYAAAEATVPITVVRATPAIQWPKPGPMSYGTKLSSEQLSAESPVPGKFEYRPGKGAVLAAGEHRLSLVFTPADTLGYSEAQAAVTLTVTKTTPAVTWPAPEPIAYGTALSATQLNAAATIPGSFAYTPAAGERLEPGEHELTVNFVPTDALNYTSARAVVPLTVNEKLPSVITWPVPAAIAYGMALNAAQLNATASVPGTFVYTPSAGHVLAPGRYTLTASFAPLDAEKYATAQAEIELEVEGPAEIASEPTAAAETPSTWTFDRIGSAARDSGLAGGSGESAASQTSVRETRKYKGSVYEKGEDGQWHLQKN